MLDLIITAVCSSIIAFLAYQWIDFRLDFFKARNIFYIKSTWNPIEWYRDLFMVSSMSRLQNIYLQTEPHRYVGIFQNLFTPFLVLRDPDLCRTVLSKDFYNFSSIIKPNISNNDSTDYFLFNLNGERWHQTRQGLSPLFTPIRQKFLSSLFQKPASELIAKLGDGLDEPVDIYTLCMRYQIQAMVLCAYGIDTNIIDDEESLFYKMSLTMQSPYESYILRCLASIVPVALRPYIFRRVVNRKSESFFRQTFEDVIRHRQKVNENTKQDFTEHFMKLIQRADTAEGKLVEWNLESAGAQYLLLVGGAGSSPAVLIASALYEIAENSAIQTKLYEELRSSFEKSNGQITYESVQEMVYLNKVVQETFRKYPVASAFLQRECSRTCQLDDTDVVVEKGMKIVIPVCALHYDPKFYPKPEIFDPERFDEENKKHRHPYAFLPFGKGPRNCPAEKFMIFSIRYAIARIIFSFEVQPTASSIEYTRQTLEMMNETVNKVRITLKQRKV